MSSWWTKLVAALRGSQATVPHSDAPLADSDTVERAQLTARVSDQPSTTAVDISEPSAAIGQRSLCDLMGDFARTIEEHLGPLAAQVSRTAELADRLLERADAGAEEVERLSEKVAMLPEITSATVESLGNLEDRLESLSETAARSADQLGHTAREIEDVQSRLEQLGLAIAQCQQACVDVVGHQEQIGGSFAALRELMEQNAELARANAAILKSLADERGTRYDELRGHLAEQYRKLAARNTIAFLLSAIAAIAAITAAVLVILEHP